CVGVLDHIVDACDRMLAVGREACQQVAAGFHLEAPYLALAHHDAAAELVAVGAEQASEASEAALLLALLRACWLFGDHPFGIFGCGLDDQIAVVVAPLRSRRIGRHDNRLALLLAARWALSVNVAG